VEAAGSSKMSVALNKLTGSHVLEDMYLHQHCCENLRSQKIMFVCNIQPVMLGGIPVFKIFVKTIFYDRHCNEYPVQSLH
jgi:hypothetical protein